ncbi:MAG: phosphotransferase [Deltaproteobacteria bacterium]|nr:phosphotransferase [Deltaproteobacteria bacterium]
MHTQTRLTIENHLEASFESLCSVTGGDINQAFKAELSDGRTVFIKTNPSAPSDFFKTEAQGLQWLRKPKVLEVPEVLGQSSEDQPAFLILEWLPSEAPSPDFHQVFGRGLALIHKSHPMQFGLEHDNYIGTLQQANKPEKSWSDFYREQRLRPQLRLACNNQRLGQGCVKALEAVMNRLESILAPEEPPARLHGDLWSGNLHVGPQGKPFLIDPSVYGGHREMDLAMMKLFGGFSQQTFDAYHETYPMEPGWEDRIELHQIYPLLVHVNLFGGHYAGTVERIAKRYS